MADSGVTIDIPDTTVCNGEDCGIPFFMDSERLGIVVVHDQHGCRLAFHRDCLPPEIEGQLLARGML